MPINPPNPHSLESMTSKSVSIRVDGVSVKGILLSDNDRLVVVMGEDGKPVVVVKNKISMYCKNENPQPLQVLACANPSIRCNGVRYVIPKEEVGKDDYKMFMSECPHQQKTCKKGNLGEWGTLPRKAVVEIIGGMILGDFPEKISEAVKKLPTKSNK